MTSATIHIRHRGRNRRFRRVLRLLPQYGATCLAFQQGHHTWIRAKFPSSSAVTLFAVAEGSHAISVTIP